MHTEKLYVKRKHPRENLILEFPIVANYVIIHTALAAVEVPPSLADGSDMIKRLKIGLGILNLKGNRIRNVELLAVVECWVCGRGCGDFGRGGPGGVCCRQQITTQNQTTPRERSHTKISRNRIQARPTPSSSPRIRFHQGGMYHLRIHIKCIPSISSCKIIPCLSVGSFFFAFKTEQQLLRNEFPNSINSVGSRKGNWNWYSL